MFLKDKHFEDLDMNFVLERLLVVTPYGQEAKNALKPLRGSELDYAYNLLECALERFTSHRQAVLQLKTLFKEIKQLRRTFDRLSAGETLSVTELYEIKYMAIYMKRIKDAMDALYWGETVGAYELRSIHPVIELLDPEESSVNNFHIYSCYSQALYDIRLKIDGLEKALKTTYDASVKRLEQAGFKVASNGDVRIKQSDSERLEAARSQKELVYQMDIPMYSLFKLKRDAAIESEIEVLKQAEEAEEEAVRVELSTALRQQLPLLKENVVRIGAVDLLIAKAQLTAAFHMTRPVVSEAGIIELKGARHLKLENSLEKENKAFVPLDIVLKTTVTVITGANMGGKTVSLRTLGQTLALAHYGFFVPCASATFYPLDYIFVSVGDAQSVDMGLSTFGAEVVSIAEVLTRIDEKGLILIDELARGTNPKEGYAISRALIEHLKTGSAKAVITTHYDGLTSGEDMTHYQVNGLKDVALETVRESVRREGMKPLHELMDYRLTEVKKDKAIPKEALRIAEIMGLQQEITMRAKEILGGSHDE